MLLFSGLDDLQFLLELLLAYQVVEPEGPGIIHLYNIVTKLLIVGKVTVRSHSYLGLTVLSVPDSDDVIVPHGELSLFVELYNS